MARRTFFVTISDSPARVVVEDVRAARRALADDLAAVRGETDRLPATASDGRSRRSETSQSRKGAEDG